MNHFSHDPLKAALETASNREAARDSLFLMADLAIEGAKRVAQVRVRNLSAGGLMVEYPHPVEQGTPVEVDVRGIGPVDGRVAWFTAGRLGIAFDKPIDPMMARKPVGGGGVSSDCR